MTLLRSCIMLSLWVIRNACDMLLKRYQPIVYPHITMLLFISLPPQNSFSRFIILNAGIRGYYLHFSSLICIISVTVLTQATGILLLVSQVGKDFFFFFHLQNACGRFEINQCPISTILLRWKFHIEGQLFQYKKQQPIRTPC